MASDPIMCAVCGAHNDAASLRCTSCGARLEAVFDVPGWNQARGFAPLWALVAFGIDASLAAIALVALPPVIAAYDPQGLPGVMILIGISFFGALVTSALSGERRTYFEPALGAALSVGPALWYLVRISDVRELSEIALVAGGTLAVMVTVLGANVGEKLRGSAPGTHRSSRA
jgi:hypothetical protein